VTIDASGPDMIDAATLHRLLPRCDAVAAIESVLKDGLDPEQDTPRVSTPVPGGEILLMPSRGDRFAGVKIATVAPGNSARGLPKIQGLYVLLDADTLAPVAVMDGAELTLIRTPAVTVTAIKHLLLAGTGGLRVDRLVVFGTSVQALAHVRTATEVLDVGEVIVIGRRPDAAARLAATVAGIASENVQSGAGTPARVGGVADLDDADVIVCATSSREPIFDGSRAKSSAVVAAIGSHGLDAREIDPELARRADVVVEARASALREGGDLIPARSVEEWERYPPANLAELVAGAVRRRPDSPALFTGVGMSWEDLAVAGKAYERFVDPHAS
jgi:ornithine cyclodeaminase